MLEIVNALFVQKIDSFFKDFKQHMVYHYEPKYSCNHWEYKTDTKFNLNSQEKTH